jgi:hypothetical protein
MVVGNVVGCLAVASVPFIDTLGYQVASSRLYCVVPWHEATGGGSITFLFMLTTCGIISYCYIMIYRSYQQTIKRTDRPALLLKTPTTDVVSARQPEDLSHSVTHEQKKSLEAQHGLEKDPQKEVQRKLLWRSMVFIASYMILWIPYACLVLYEVVTAHPISMDGHLGVTFFINLSTAVNPLILIAMSKTYREEIHCLLGI